MKPDKYFGASVQLSDPANQAIRVNPSDTAKLTDTARAMYVGVGGDINMTGEDDDAPVVWKNVPSGSFLPYRLTQVFETGTTATDILALY